MTIDDITHLYLLKGYRTGFVTFKLSSGTGKCVGHRALGSGPCECRMLTNSYNLLSQSQSQAPFPFTGVKTVYYFITRRVTASIQVDRRYNV